MIPPILGNAIALLLVALLVFVCARYLWRSHKAGSACGGCGGCSGGSCASCGHQCHQAAAPKGGIGK